MYNISRKHYILQMSSGYHINIYYKPNTGLCCSELTAGNTWTPPAIILKNALPSFSACMDTADNIHLLCQDERCNLLYIRYKDGSWLSKLVSRNKNEKRPHICNLGNKIYFFYVDETPDKIILVYQKYSEGCFTSPKSIDYIRKSSKSYIVLSDKNGTTCIFYMTPANTLHYKTLNTDGDGWSDPINININIGMNLSKVQILSVSGDQAGNFHLSLQRTSVQKYELIYLKIPACREDPYNEAALSSSPYNFLNSSLLVLNKKTIIYWVREENIFYCISADNGISWSKPEKLGSFNMELFYCTRFSSNDSRNNIDTINADIPAILSDGYQPVFINEFKENNTEVHDTEDFETSILSAMEIITTIDEVNKVANETETAIKKLDGKIHKFTSNYNTFTFQQLQIDRDIILLKSKIELLKA